MAGGDTRKLHIRHGLARVLSKQGVCSRSEAERRIRDGRVTLDGRVIRDPECPASMSQHVILIDGMALQPIARIYIMLNKPRGLVTTIADERQRDTVYRCFDGADLPWIAPVGRLDKASEGLLLFCNDPAWAAAITSPATGPDKTYHVQVDAIPDAELLARVMLGIDIGGERLTAKSATLLRAGQKNAWLELVLEEGRNRQIRRLLAACDIAVLRLVRVAIGSVQLGVLGKGAWRMLDADEVRALCPMTQGDS
ncbi:MAG: rRNA pseudouridine synthase [Pseudomonadota bacterium]|nr:rRNA pseudouridine synthase [Pseudomonadota bacterium]